MDGHSISSFGTPETNSPETPKAVRRHRRRSARPVEAQGKSTLSQVTIQVPRDVLASFDDFAATCGVNRSHLIREALTAYAGLLDSGCRVYQVPGAIRIQDRAA